MQLDDGPSKTADSTPLELSTGKHTITLQVDRQRRDPLRIELVDAAGSSGKAQLVGGK
jgi:hypothetical protein